MGTHPSVSTESDSLYTTFIRLNIRRTMYLIIVQRYFTEVGSLQQNYISENMVVSLGIIINSFLPNI
jgi:hypothetical protein